MATVGHGILTNSINLAGGHSLTSIFFLLSAFLRSAWGRGERRTLAMHIRNGYLRRNHDPPLKCSESSPQHTLLQ